MNQNSHGFFFLISFLFIFLLFSQSASARFSAAKQGKFAGLEEPGRKLNHGIVREESLAKFPQIMGGREKGEEEKEEEEWERRMMLAHLDYVYTQNEKP